MAQLDPLVVRMLGDGSDYQKMLAMAQAQTQQAMSNIGSSATSAGSSIASMAASAAGALGAIGVAAGLASTGLKAISLSASAEQAKISFSTMLGGAEKGEEMFRRLADLAANTPLRLTQVQDAAKTLLQFGVAGNDIVPTLRMLGDVTGGDAEKMKSMSLAFGQMTAAGRLMGQDLLQMINAGFNPLQEISRKTGKSMGDLKAQMEKGAITTEMVEDAFRSATSAGGKFDGLMAKQAKSLTGQWSTLVDNVEASLRSVGDVIIEGFKLKEAIAAVSSFAQDVGNWFASMAPTFRAWADSAWAVITPVWDGIVDAATIAWDRIKAAMEVFVAWAHPIAQALASFFTTAWEMISEGAVSLWNTVTEVFQSIADFISEIWESIGGNSEETWSWIRDVIRDAILMAEFALRNFGQVAEYVWTGTALSFVRFSNQVQHFFTDVIPALLSWFADNWKEVFTTSVNFVSTLFTNLGENIYNFFANLPGLIKGSVKFGDIWKPLMEGFENTIKSMPEIPKREMGEIEKALQEDFDKQGEKLGQSFEAFKKAKLEAFKAADMIPPEAVEQVQKVAIDLGSRTGSSTAAAATKAAKTASGKQAESGVQGIRFQSATYMAEAATYLSGRYNPLPGQESKTTPGGAIAGADFGGMSGGPALQEGGASNQQNKTVDYQNRVVELLQQISDNTKGGGGTTMSPVNLA